MQASDSEHQQRLTPSGSLDLRGRPTISSAATKRVGLRNFAPIAERLARRSPPVIHPERFTFCEDDIVNIDPEDIVEAFNWQVAPIPPISSSSIRLRPFLSQSRSSLTSSKSGESRNRVFYRIKRRLNLEKQQGKQNSEGKKGPLVLSLPHSLPSVHEVSSDEEVSVHAVALDDADSQYFKSSSLSETTLADSSATSTAADISVAQEGPIDLDLISPSSPHSTAPTFASISSSASHSHSSYTLDTVRKSLRRLANRTKGNFFSPGAAVPEVYQISRTPHTSNEAEVSSSSEDTPHTLPELSFDTTPLSILIHEDQDIKDSSLEKEQPEVSLGQQVPEPSSSSLPLIRYEFVDPQTLTASPPVSLFTDYSPATASIQVPSPSWLSRNVGEFDFSVNRERPLLRIHPPPSSPAPLPILPRGSVEAPQALRRDNTAEHLTVPGSAYSTSSSVTLYSRSQRVSYLSDGSGRSQSQTFDRSSIISFRHSFVDNRGSIQSFVTCASFALGRDEDKNSPVVSNDEDSSKQPRFYLLLQPPSPVPSSLQVPAQESRLSLSPLDIFDTNNPFGRTPDRSRTSIAEAAPVVYERFIPNPQVAPDRPFPLPVHLVALARFIISSGWKHLAEMEENPQAKPVETIDFGHEVDYSGYEFFKDPPPPRAPPQFTNEHEAFVPDQAVIDKNEMFNFALKAAPNVLYGRYRQFGQLGVLAWCSEFAEMIEEIKRLGFDGAMFVTTRVQALRMCEEILRLEMKIDMQLIVMYLCHQIARLRRFLDGDREWNDYPIFEFPLNPYAE